MPDTVGLEVSGSVATVSLDRPQVRNAFNASMITELTDACAYLAGRDDIAAVILRGAGKSFSAGADVEWMRASLDYSREDNVADARRMAAMFSAIDLLPQPVIGRVHGAALGGGMGLMAVCDVVVAAEDAVFGFTETKLGIVPAVISAFVLPRIGPSWARALYLTGERFSAQTAQAIGLVHWIVPAEELDERIQAVVAEVLSSGRSAAREAKRLIRDLRSSPPSEWSALTAERIATLRASEEGQEGLRAFLDKRPARWINDSD